MSDVAWCVDTILVLTTWIVTWATIGAACARDEYDVLDLAVPLILAAATFLALVLL